MWGDFLFPPSHGIRTSGPTNKEGFILLLSSFLEKASGEIPFSFAQKRPSFAHFVPCCALMHPGSEKAAKGG